MARQRSYAPSGYSSSNAVSFSGKTNSSYTGSTNRERGAAVNRTQTITPSAKAKVARDIVKDNATAFKNLKYTGSNAPSILGKILDATGVSKNTFNTNLSLSLIHI